jgi:hypothetical protein
VLESASVQKISVLLAAVAMVLTVVHASPPPQAPDFVPGCTIPFVDIQGANAVGCTIAGNLGADAANQLQNRTKNNLCATGTPAEATWITFKKLQANTDTLPAPFSYGSHSTLPADRSPIRAAGFHTTTNGDEVHEGTLVRMVGFLLHGAYSNQSTGEGVNRDIHGVKNNDIHLAFAKTKPTAATNECNSLTAEIIPHLRPPEWLVLATLHKTQTKTAKERIAALDLDRPLRITGQMMLDGLHNPCTPGHPQSPKRISVWEIHPVYSLDVCTKKAMSACRVNVATDWRPLHEFLQDVAFDAERGG